MALAERSIRMTLRVGGVPETRDDFRRRTIAERRLRDASRAIRRRKGRRTKGEVLSIPHGILLESLLWGSFCFV